VYTYGALHSSTFGRDDFPSFVERMQAADEYPYTRWIRDHRIDVVIRLEHLHAELGALLEAHAGIVLEQPPPRENTSQRGSYREYYDDRSVELVWQMFAYEIETFGYEF
jgi:hypothetical protein